MVGAARSTPAVPVQASARGLRFGAGLGAAWWLLRRLVRLAVIIVTTPAARAMAGVTLVALVLGLVVDGRAGLAWLLALAAGLVVWWRVWPATFRRLVLGGLRSWGRDWLTYRHRWPAAMDTAGLGTAWQAQRYLPTLLSVVAVGSVDRVRVRMLPGQTVEDWSAAGPRLAQTFGASSCAVRSQPGRPHEVTLTFLGRDPLLQPVEPLPAAPGDPLAVLAAGLPLARAEDGTVWRLRLVGSHLLVVGATGAGKGSVIWSLLWHLAPTVRAGLVEVWCVDPKGGMELAPGQPLFARFCHGDADAGQQYEAGFAALLEDAVTVMRRRQDRLRGVTRLHQPSTSEPLIVVLVDELAALTGWVLDRTVRKRIETALSLLLSQGRAVGVVVVGAVQDPRKDVLPLRDLFPTRVCLRVNEAEQVHLVLGAGARNRGALADLIPDTLPGVGYVAVDGLAEPVRVRFSHITDSHITELVGNPVEAVRPQLRAVDGGAAA